MKHRIIFKTIVGSQAYGTAVEGSDIDIKGVYIQDPSEILGFGYQPQIDVNKDEVYYEIRRFLDLLSTANPTVLEMLFSPSECIQILEPEFKYLIKNRNIFLTKMCGVSFGGYAVQQIKKAKGTDKKMNWEKSEMVRKTPLDFCYVYEEGGSTPLDIYLNSVNFYQEFCGLAAIDHIKDGYALYYDWDLHYNNAQPLGLKGIVLPDSNSIRTSSIPKELEPIAFVHYNENGYVQHCKKYNEYQTWLKNRNTQRYVDIENHNQKIDGKNLLHCRRLIDTCRDIVTKKTLVVKRPNADYLISIRQGKVDLQTLLDSSEKDVKEIDELFKNSDLPTEVNKVTLNKILNKIRYWKK